MCLGIPGRVVDIRDEAGLPMGRVDFGGVRKEACLAYVPETQVGDYVIVHVGFAISRVDEDEALKTLEILATMGDMVEVELATMGPGMDAPTVTSDEGTGPPILASPPPLAPAAAGGLAVGAVSAGDGATAAGPPGGAG
jgi:hydrogenase expression/formation protein HypC